MSGNEKDSEIAASKSDFCGVFYTQKKGDIELSWSENTINGGLFGDTVKLSGSNLTINAGEQPDVVSLSPATYKHKHRAVMLSVMPLKRY